MYYEIFTFQMFYIYELYLREIMCIYIHVFMISFIYLQKYISFIVFHFFNIFMIFGFIFIYICVYIHHDSS